MPGQIIEIHTKHTTVGLYAYFLGPRYALGRNTRRPLILICPGGGYEYTSDREAEPIAIRFLAKGFHACVLRYSVKPEHFPTSLTELALSVAWLRAHAAEYLIDPGRIVICGFSAGAHLAASLGTFWNRDFLRAETGLQPEQMRPDGLILSYPVITSGSYAHRGSFNALLGEHSEDPAWLELVSLEKQVTEEMPGTFLWHTYEDQAVPVENSLLLAQAMRAAGVAFELHIFPEGHHGLSLADEETDEGNGDSILPECAAWVDLAADWVRRTAGTDRKVRREGNHENRDEG